MQKPLPVTHEEPSWFRWGYVVMCVLLLCVGYEFGTMALSPLPDEPVVNTVVAAACVFFNFSGIFLGVLGLWPKYAFVRLQYPVLTVFTTSLAVVTFLGAMILWRVLLLTSADTGATSTLLGALVFSTGAVFLVACSVALLRRTM